MSRLSPGHSEVLSLLLDEVTGTQEAINIRQDYCRLLDYKTSAQMPGRQHYTGSKAEGLDLPGSDNDYMQDINDLYNIKVVQSLSEISDTPIFEEFLLCTDTMNPGFALLRRIRQHTEILMPMLQAAIEIINGEQYLSSNELVNNALRFSHTVQSFMTGTRQGPSMEQRMPHEDPSEPGFDQVLSIHCGFWPNDATEWVRRPRYFGWPTSHDISSIVDFGCHLVAVGHPNSDTQFTEWRLSFSIAERTLVWSFNHIQMQCYACLKIILKQFIKLKCSHSNQILCSYFIKTFLFWKYETTHLDFWCERNFKECLMYLLREFCQCLHEGVIMHYFLPRFNLLSVKLTLEAQTELIQLYDIVIQFDINILTECEALQNVMSKFLSANENQMNVVNNARKTNMLQTDKQMMKTLSRLINVLNFFDSRDLRDDIIDKLFNNIMPSIWPQLLPHIDQRSFSPVLHLFVPFMRSIFPKQSTFAEIRNHILNHHCKTTLKFLLLKYLSLLSYIESLFPLPHFHGNKDLYKLQRITHDNTSFNILSSKLWYAIALMKKCDYASALSTINHVISSIPSYVMYYSDTEILNAEKKCLYVDKFLNSRCTTQQRARKAWLMDLIFRKFMSKILPLAIQIELYFCCEGYDSMYRGVQLSPYTCTYYLMFLCYHELGQYDNRDRSLCNLIEVVNNQEQKGRYEHHSYNIAGHCLLIAGKINQASEMFKRSRGVRYNLPLPEDFNSVTWYIRNFCSETR